MRKIKNFFKETILSKIKNVFNAFTSAISNVILDITDSSHRLNSKIKRDNQKILKKEKQKNKEKTNLVKNINETKEQINSILHNRIFQKVSFIVVLTVLLLFDAFGWFYNEYVSKGTVFTVGRLRHEVVQYDETGTEIHDGDDVITLMNVDNISNTTKGTRYISIENIGTLDLMYYLTFQLDTVISDAGIMYYRIYEVTDEVNSSVINISNPTLLKAYAAANPTPANLETDTSIPVSNLSTIPNLITSGQIDKDDDSSKNIRYYRIDYGVYQTVNTDIYSDKNIIVHAQVLSSQVGMSIASSEGVNWEVENETQFRDAITNASSGDTIVLKDNIQIEGSIDIGRRVHLDLNSYKLTVTGDLVWDFVELGDLDIKASDTGQLDVGNDLYINAPKSKVHIQGDNNDYDIFVGGKFTVNGLQNEEEDGVLLEAVRIVKNKIGNIPVDVTVLSNTRLTIAPDVSLGYIIGAEGATNIEIINNGDVVQLQLQDMNLIDSFSKAQIYVYNLGTILGIAGGASIVLPSNSTPYLGANRGNTLIIKGITSNDITVSGSDNFTKDDIGSSDTEESVIPIEGEENAYIVYIRTPEAAVRELLINYFQTHDSLSPMDDVGAITKLIIYTVNTQYVENEDFTFLASNEIPNLAHLDISNSSVRDITTINKIPAYAMNGKTSLKVLYLPKTVTVIGEYAFNNVSLGRIYTDSFSFLTIPSTVTSIGSYAFYGAKYVKFESQNPPVIGENAFNNSSSGVRYFVPEPSISLYQNTNNIGEEYVHITAELSDNKVYFVYNYDGGLGISMYVSSVNVGASINIPNTITLSNRQYNVTSIGVSAFRNITSPTTGTTITLPTTVTKIDSYAFYEKNIIDINIPNVITIGKYAFYATSITSVEANYVTEIGEYAFYNTSIEYASFKSLITLGNYALANTTTLYDLNLGTVATIGDYAVYNNPQLGRVYFENTDAIFRNNAESINLIYGENALFYEWGKYLDGRLRIYVPDGNSDNGTPYVSLYKKIFADVEEFVYVTGSISGSYTHVAIPYDFGEYTLREVIKTNGSGSIINGLEIISYQGADLTSSYELPQSFTIDGTKLNVISIGDGAFRNSIAETDASISILNNNLAYIGNYAFYGLGLTVIRSNSVLTIGDYAFANSKLQMAEFKSLGSIGDYAVSDISTLNHLNLGTVKTIGVNAISNNINLVQLYINNVVNNITLKGVAFNNIGTNAGERLRIYVPYASLTYYKTLLSSYEDYIYATGYLKGSYINSPIMYDIGEYSVREITLENADGTSVNGWEYVEYHGREIDSSFEIPQELEVADDRLSATLVRSGSSWGGNGTYTSTYLIYVTNVGSEVIDGWEAVIPTTGFTSLTMPSKPNSSTLTTTSTELIVSNASWNNKIEVGATQYISVQLTWTGSETDVVTEVTARKTGSFGVMLPVISIGDNAFKHTSVALGSSVNVISENILNVGNNAFNNLSGINKVELPNVVSIGNNAFSNTTVTDVSVPNVNSVGASAFENVESLYRIDLGEVSVMGSNAITNAPLLYQVFFSNTGHSLNISGTAINNVGSVSAERLRFYVTNTYDSNNKSYVEAYKSIFTEYKEKFFAYDHIVGSYVPVNTNVDIGEYSLRTITVKDKDNVDTTGWQYVEYHGLTLTSEFLFPESVDTTSSASDLVGKFTTDNQWQNSNGYTGSYTLTVTNNTEDDVYNWEILVPKRNFDSMSLINYSNFTVTDNDNYVILSSNNTILSAGSTYTIYGQITWTGDYSLRVNSVIVRKRGAGEGEYPVISVGANAFKFTNIALNEKINISSPNLLEINESAFIDLEGLGTINLPNVVRIGNSAFYNTTITDVSIPNVNSVGTNAFANASSLMRIDLGKVASLGENAITNAPYLYQVFFSNTGHSLNIHNNAINTVGSLTNDRIRFYVSNTYDNSNNPYVNTYKELFSNYKEKFFPYDYILGSYTPANATIDIGSYSIRVLTLPNASSSNVTGWEYVEYHGDSITSSFVIENSITHDSKTYNVISIGDYAFNNAIVSSGSTFNIVNNNLLNIGNYAFYSFSGLNQIEADNVINVGVDAFRNGALAIASFKELKYAGSYAFGNIQNLKYIHLGNIESLSEGLLYNDINVYQVFFTNTSALSNASKMNIAVGENCFYNLGRSAGIRFRIYVPDGIANTSTSLTYVAAYKNTLPSSVSEYIFPTGVIYGSYTDVSGGYDIGQYMLRKVTMKNNTGTNMTGWEIVDYHGEDITNTTVIPSAFTVNGETSNVISIGDYAYRFISPSAGSNWNPTLGNSLFNIGDYAFYQSNIRTITGVRLTKVGKYAFADCEYLTTVTFQGIVYLDDYSFYSNSRLTYIEIGDGVEYIGNYALYNDYYGSPTGTAGPTTTLRILNTTPPAVGEQPFPEIYSWFIFSYSNLTISVPQAARNTYRNTTPWRDYTIQGSQYSGSFSFQLITDLSGTTSAEITSYTGNSTTVEVPDTVTDSSGTEYNVTSIKGDFLDGNSYATTLILPRYLNNIDGNLLGGNESVRTINVDSSNTYFVSNSGVLLSYDQTILIRFAPSRNVSSYSMPSAVRVIADYAFANVNYMSSLTLSSNLLVIGSNAFDQATTITTIRFQTNTPPYLTGFKTFAVPESGLTIRVPRNYLTTYQNSLYYYYYRTYMTGS